ncbi:hypothetical protein AXG93_4625s1160 [Marchantia polymorpha subsp. ruderalis]|uniref:Uncharacterized protein n=1 Tax=Marchantia polymorpha subsp. ruderalis TaxID=1480154 RepID=A0A176VT54_MARPO|nr:hypothetical protein AXG93_4625s1160 [Marchantia polymorpha subsp. ruderalis]
MVYVWSSSRAAAGAAALMGSGSIGRVGTGSRKQVVQVLLSLVALAFCFAQTNATICKDKTKNPYGGETCCGKRICRDLQYDEMNCGLCNRYCAYGLSCCSGKCVNINGDDNKNCGRCGNVCPKKYKCTFGMCGYADDEDQGEEDRKK